MQASAPVIIAQRRRWQRWVPYTAIAWSLGYATLGLNWVMSGRGFPYAPQSVSDGLVLLVGRFGLGVDWIFILIS